MKLHRHLLCALAAGLLLTSCGHPNVTPDVTTTLHESEATTTTVSEIITTTTTITETTPIPEAVWDYFGPLSTLQFRNIATVRWGNVIEESRYQHVSGKIRDENGEERDRITEMVYIEVEVLHVWMQTDEVREIGGTGALHSFADVRHLWVSEEAMAYIEQSETAVVFIADHPYYFAPGTDSSHVRRYMCLDGFTWDFGVLNLVFDYDFPRPDIFPIKDGKMEIRKEDTEEWSYVVDAFLEYNEDLDRVNSEVPRFADGMTVEEFKQLIDAIKAVEW